MAERPNYAEVIRNEHIGPGQTGDNIDAKRVANYTWDGTNWQRSGLNGNALTTQIDQSGTIIYVGETNPGSATSASAWRITKIDKTSNPILIQYAGNGAFTQVWDNRASLTYN